MKLPPSATPIRERRSKEADCPRLLRGGQKRHPGTIIGMTVRIRKMGLAEGAVLNASSMTRLKKEDGEAVWFPVRSPSSMCAKIFEPGKSPSKIDSRYSHWNVDCQSPGIFYFNSRCNILLDRRILCAGLPVCT